MPSIALRLPLHGLRSQFLHWAYSYSYPVYAYFKPGSRPAWQVSKAMLLDYPPGSLGRQVGQFLEAHELDLISSFENHDVFHVLLKYGLSAPEEVALQWCLIGNGKRSVFSFLAAAVGTFCFPEHWGWFRRAYQEGKGLRPFHHWYFEYLLQENLAALQHFIEGGQFCAEDELDGLVG